MDSREFYESLSSLPSTYKWAVDTNNKITATATRGSVKGQTFNPVTALAYRLTGNVFGTNKRETMKAANAIGLKNSFTNNVYEATMGTSNRGNAQVVRGRIKLALEI